MRQMQRRDMQIIRRAATWGAVQEYLSQFLRVGGGQNGCVASCASLHSKSSLRSLVFFGA